MNRARAAARPRATRTTRTRSGSTTPGNYSTARDLVTLAHVLRTSPFFRRRGLAPSGDAAHRRPPAHVREPQRRSCGTAVGQRRQDRPHAAAPATCSSAPAAATASQLICAVLGEPSDAARDADTLRAAARGLRALPAHRAPCVDGRASLATRARSATAAAPSSTLVAGAHGRGGSSRRGQRARGDGRGRRARASVAGPIRAARARRRSRSASAAKLVDRVPLVARPTSPRADRGSAPSRWSRARRRSCSLVVVAGGTVAAGSRSAGAARPRRAARAARPSAA